MQWGRKKEEGGSDGILQGHTAGDNPCLCRANRLAGIYTNARLARANK